jgi:D-lyxose ketol-isomerase
MLRSQINALIEEATGAFAAHDVHLPPFGYWTAEDWLTKGAEYDEIRDCRLGWDVTDFGSGRFEEIGLVVFTVRNGHPSLPRYRSTVYCEKLLLVGENQRTPMHRHVVKQEDIICRAGGSLVCRVYNCAEDGGLAAGDVTLSLDGVAHCVPAGRRLVLDPGASIRLTPGVYHEFYAAPGRGPAIVGEVSTVNDDANDNVFLEAPARFPSVIEDEPPRRLLCTEYAPAPREARM